ncbi:MAG: type I restriction-modification enzyme R subunit C-terminal domain-containing protein [Cyclobacteriaceae bacterium]
MKTIFNQSECDVLLDRIALLSAEAQGRWGKMNVYQMLKHCIVSEHMFLGDSSYDRLFVGKLFGKMALKGILKDEQPLKKNQPTHPEFKMTGNGEVMPLKDSWRVLLSRYVLADQNAFTGFVHPFFGAMTKDEIGRYARIHFNSYNPKQQEFLNFVLDQYVKQGFEELDDSKLPDLLQLKYRAISDAREELGDVASIRETFIGFQEYLYGEGA